MGHSISPYIQLFNTKQQRLFRMGRGRKHTTLKMNRKKGQAKKKARLLKRIEAGKKK
ncbi:MAG: hypothetical protein K9K67_07570 [Bacteriovoracaceae bacterium]|nr:hypothetical protein [Bacteriovoracaceae bacterium]